MCGVETCALGTTQLDSGTPGWSVIGAAVEISPGEYVFTDIPTGAGAKHFYRVRVPGP